MVSSPPTHTHTHIPTKVSYNRLNTTRYFSLQEVWLLLWVLTILLIFFENHF